MKRIPNNLPELKLSPRAKAGTLKSILKQQARREAYKQAQADFVLQANFVQAVLKQQARAVKQVELFKA